MPIRICPKCKKSFTRKDIYNYHINRKNSCIDELSKIEILEKKVKELDDKLTALLEEKKEDTL
jgi:uncharacterized C2H2 Zn-finger protein